MLTLYIHPNNPQARLIQQAVEAIRKDQLVILPGDRGYFMTCSLHSKATFNKYQLLNPDLGYPLEILCQSISQIAQFVQVNDQDFQTLKHSSWDDFKKQSFVLPSTKKTPNWLTDQKKTLAVSMVKSTIIRQIIEQLEEPLLCLPLPVLKQSLQYSYEIQEAFDRKANLMLDAGDIENHMTNFINLSKT